MVGDILWAVTRVDCVWQDRIVYETVAVDLIDSEWHRARRRRPGPVDFTRLGVYVRHAIIIAAVMIASEPDFCRELRLAWLARTKCDACARAEVLGNLGGCGRGRFAQRWPSDRRTA